jgi:hypothetical protein
VLFADISGFTALTESHARHPQVRGRRNRSLAAKGTVEDNVSPLTASVRDTS